MVDKEVFDLITTESGIAIELNKSCDKIRVLDIEFLTSDHQTDIKQFKKLIKLLGRISRNNFKRDLSKMLFNEE